MNSSFKIKEFFSFGWQTFKKNAFFLVILYLVTTLISATLSFIHWKSEDVSFFSFLITLLNWIVSIFINLVLINVALLLAKSKKVHVADLFTPFSRFFPYLGASILYGLIVMAGVILLIFPAIIWGLKFVFWSFFIVDQSKGPIEALKASGTITYGYKWKLLGFFILAVVLNIVGFLCLGIGLLVTLPVTAIATARIYVQLQKDL